MNNTPEINNNPDFTLCKNSAKALHSDATKWFLYTFLEQNLAH